MDFLDKIGKQLKSNFDLSTPIEDPKMMKLFGAYVQGERAFKREARKAVNAFKKGQKVDFSKLNFSRRIFEQAAAKYFSFRPGIKQADAPNTNKRKARDMIKDAVTAQLHGDAKRSLQDITGVKAEMRKHSKKVLDQYKKALAKGEVPDDVKKALVNSLGMAQAMEMKGPEVSQLEKVLNDMLKDGKLKTRDVKIKK